MNESLLQKNIAFFEDANKDFLEVKGINIDIAREKACLYTYEEEASYWTSLENKSVHLPQQSPRNQESVDFVLKTLDENNTDESIEPIINRQIDLTLWRYLYKLREITIESDFDPDTTMTNMGAGGIAIIALGTGSGELLKKQIETFQPYKLFVITNDWNDFASSFWVIDWKQIYIDFNNSGREISVSCIKDSRELLAQCQSGGTLWLDHAYIYTSRATDEKLKKWSNILHSHETANLIHYLGYTVDEYNMMVQSSLTLKREPKLFVKPIKPIGGNFIVCGSGPSLDRSIETLRKLQKSHTIVCGGSSYKALLDNDIRVDYLTLMERDYDTGNDDYAGYNKSSNKKITTRLVMADVCWHEMLNSFEEACVFFRSALTPLSIFSTDPNEVLGFEGPEAVNAACAFCTSLGAERIVFFGVDLGSYDEKRARSEKVLGNSERKFDIKRSGNLIENIYTCTSMLNVKQVIEALIHDTNKNQGKEIEYINCSNGINIEGTNSMKPENYLKFEEQKATINKNLEEWWQNLQIYDEDRFNRQWEARNPREQTYKLTRRLEKLFSGNSVFYPTVLREVEEMMDLGCNIGEQFPRRVMRGTILKAVLALSQELQIMRGNKHKNIDTFGGQGRGELKNLALTLEKEIYMLLDYIENEQG